LTAKHCQKETVKTIIEKEANYVIQVKGNQRALLDSIKSEMENYESENYASPGVRMQTIKKRGAASLETAPPTCSTMIGASCTAWLDDITHASLLLIP